MCHYLTLSLYISTGLIKSDLRRQNANLLAKAEVSVKRVLGFVFLCVFLEEQWWWCNVEQAFLKNFYERHIGMSQ